MIRTRPRAEPHRVDVRRPRPGRMSRSEPPPPATPPKPPRRGCRKPVLLALAAVVLGPPMLLAGMWSFRPDLGRPLTLFVLLVAFFAVSLISRPAAAIADPRWGSRTPTAAGRVSTTPPPVLRGAGSRRHVSVDARLETRAGDTADISVGFPAAEVSATDGGAT